MYLYAHMYIKEIKTYKKKIHICKYEYVHACNIYINVLMCM